MLPKKRKKVSFIFNVLAKMVYSDAMVLIRVENVMQLGNVFRLF